MTPKTLVRTIFLCCAATFSFALPAAADIIQTRDSIANGIDPNVDGLASLYQQVANLKTLFGCP